MTTPIKRVERSSSIPEAPKAPESDLKKRDVEEAAGTPVPFPGLLAVQNGIAAVAAPQAINVETLLGMLAQEALPVFSPAVSAQMVVDFFATEEVAAFVKLQAMPTICPHFVQSYFQWEAAAAEHVTELSHDIDLDSLKTMMQSEVVLLRFLPLCKTLQELTLNISGRFAEGKVMIDCVQRVLKKLPPHVNEFRLFIDMNECSDQHPCAFAEFFDSLMLGLISHQQLSAVDLDVISSIDWDELVDCHDIPKMISEHARPFQLRMIERDDDWNERSLYQYKYVQGQEWQDCAEFYDDMVADPKQTEVFSLLILKKLFPKPGQLAPKCVGVMVDNETRTVWEKNSFVDKKLSIDPTIRQGVIWCESKFPSKK